MKRITRCAAVNVDPETAARDLGIPQALTQRLGHNECGVYAEGDRRRHHRRRRYHRGGRAEAVGHVRAGAAVAGPLQNHVHEPRAPQSAAAGRIAAEMAARLGNDPMRDARQGWRRRDAAWHWQCRAPHPRLAAPHRDRVPRR